MATNIAPHNLNEVINATLLLISKPDATLSEVMKKLKGPDFPTGGKIMGETESSTPTRPAAVRSG